MQREEREKEKKKKDFNSKKPDGLQEGHLSKIQAFENRVLFYF